VGEAIPRPPEDSEMSHIEVWASNWDSQSKLIHVMFESNICAAVGVETFVDHKLKRIASLIMQHTCLSMSLSFRLFKIL
jgi:tRNA(Ile2) C34 agmatinyltransferase TiaS